MGYRISAVIADTLAPRVCVGCGGEGAWLCGACGNGVTAEQNVTCVGCERLSPSGLTCDGCRPVIRVAGVIAIARYRDPVIRDLIQAVKYAPARDAVGAFTLLIHTFLASGGAALIRSAVDPSPLIVPVPLHWRRRAQRGFNQSAAIAAVLAGAGVGEVVPTLARTRATAAQVGLPSAERGENVRAAFAYTAPGDAVRDRTVLLVDDVVTTGATMSACADVLRDAGAHAVWGFAIARG